MASAGRRDMLDDLDKPACLTYASGLDPENLECSLHDVLTGRSNAADAVTKAGRC